MQEPERADFLEAFREDVLQEARDEGQGIQRHGLPGLVAGLIAEGDRAILHAHQAPVGQGHPIDVGGQVLQDGAAIADGLAVHDPICGPGFRGDLGEQVGIGRFEGVPECGAEDRAQGRPGTRNFWRAGFQSPVVGSTTPAGTRKCTCR